VTDLLSSVEHAEAASEDRPASLLRAAVMAAVWAAGLGLIVITVVVLLAWSGDSRSAASAATALRMAADGWILAHGAPLKAAGATYGLVPLGLTAVPAYLLSRAGASLARSAKVADLRGATAATAALALAYAFLAVVVTGSAATAQVAAGPLRAGLAAGLLAAVCGGGGVLRGAGLWRSAWLRVPAPVRDAAQGGAIAVAVVLAGGALVAGGALAVSAVEAGRVFDALGTGLVGGIFLLLVSLAYLPNATVFSAAFVVGPGFAVGTGTLVSVFGVRLHPVPALPMLAALPGGPVDRWLTTLLVLPVAGGLLAGAVIARHQGGVPRRRLLACAAATGPVAGLILAVFCLVSAGSAGGGRLVAVGPSAWRVALTLALEVAVPAVASAWWPAWWAARRAARGR